MKRATTKKIFPKCWFSIHRKKRDESEHLSRWRVCVRVENAFRSVEIQFPRNPTKNGTWAGGRGLIPIGHQHSRTKFIIQLRFNLQCCSGQKNCLMLTRGVRMKVHFWYLVTLDKKNEIFVFALVCLLLMFASVFVLSCCSRRACIKRWQRRKKM